MTVVDSSVEFSPPYTQKRIRQNLKEVNFSEDSDDDQEWSEDMEDNEEFFSCAQCCYTSRSEKSFTEHGQNNHKKNVNPKRKKVNSSSESSKKSATTSQIKCDDCGISFTRKDNLKLHICKKHR